MSGRAVALLERREQRLDLLDAVEGLDGRQGHSPHSRSGTPATTPAPATATTLPHGGVQAGPTTLKAAAAAATSMR